MIKWWLFYIGARWGITLVRLVPLQGVFRWGVVEHKTRVFSAVCWPFGKRVMELLNLDKKEREAESQFYNSGKWGVTWPIR